MSTRTTSVFTLVVLVFGIISILVGSLFITQGIMKSQVIAQALKAEGVTYPVDGNPVAIDSAEKAAFMAETLKEHRGSIAPSYQALLAGEKFNPTNPAQLSYMAAINMENSLNLAQLSFGLTQVIQAMGAAFVIIGIALVLLAVYIRRDRLFRSAV